MALQSHWQDLNPVSLVLWPLSALLLLLVFVRRQLYAVGVLKRFRASVPVIVVGNIAVGGTGKTPLTIALLDLLRQQGISAGVVSRGYKGQVQAEPLLVNESTSAVVAGDEPVLIARQSGVPVCVFPKRKLAIEKLLQAQSVDVVICDDGLQHYALERDLEIAVVDAQKLHGNGFLLPAGPLREPVSRLNFTELVVFNHTALSPQCRSQVSVDDSRDSDQEGETSAGSRTSASQLPQAEAEEMFFRLEVTGFRNLATGEIQPLDTFKPVQCVAIAGIANPDSFFSQLERAGLLILPLRFDDHHRYQEQDFEHMPGEPVLMTEKDAVKCRDLKLRLDHFWEATTKTVLSPVLEQTFLSRVNDLLVGSSARNE